MEHKGRLECGRGGPFRCWHVPITWKACRRCWLRYAYPFPSAKSRITLIADFKEPFQPFWTPISCHSQISMAINLCGRSSIRSCVQKSLNHKLMELVSSHLISVVGCALREKRFVLLVLPMLSPLSLLICFFDIENAAALPSLQYGFNPKLYRIWRAHSWRTEKVQEVHQPWCREDHRPGLWTVSWDCAIWSCMLLWFCTCIYLKYIQFIFPYCCLRRCWCEKSSTMQDNFRSPRWKEAVSDKGKLNPYNHGRSQACHYFHLAIWAVLYWMRTENNDWSILQRKQAIQDFRCMLSSASEKGSISKIEPPLARQELLRWAGTSNADTEVSICCFWIGYTLYSSSADILKIGKNAMFLMYDALSFCSSSLEPENLSHWSCNSNASTAFHRLEFI